MHIRAYSTPVILPIVVPTIHSLCISTLVFLSVRRLRAHLPPFRELPCYVIESLPLEVVLEGQGSRKIKDLQTCPPSQVPDYPRAIRCSMSSEWGLLGLARRTYSLDCPPDIPSVRLFRFMLRFRSKAVPEGGRRALRRRSRERTMALQELPPHAGYAMVIRNAYTRVYKKSGFRWSPLSFRLCL